MSAMFLTSVWLPNVTKVSGRNEKKACVIALTRLLCESDLCLSQANNWKAVVEHIIRVLEDVDASPSLSKDDDEALLDLEQTGYEAGFSKLHFASVVPADLLSEFPPGKSYFVTSLSALSAAKPGVVSMIFHFLLHDHSYHIACSIQRLRRLFKRQFYKHFNNILHSTMPHSSSDPNENECEILDFKSSIPLSYTYSFIAGRCTCR